MLTNTHTTRKVAMALIATPDDPHWGYELAKKTKLQSPTIYAILDRMEAEGYLTKHDEDTDAGTREYGRPPRKYVTLTELGKKELNNYLVENLDL